VKQLPIEEQVHLKTVLERKLSDEVARRLLEAGLISRLPAPRTEANLERLRSWQPIKIDGKPLSESIVEDRH
jgi:hypothetical protein